MCIDGDRISLVELILHRVINLNFCVARSWLFSQQPGWRRGMSLASHAQGLRFDPHQRRTCHISS